MYHQRTKNLRKVFIQIVIFGYSVIVFQLLTKIVIHFINSDTLQNDGEAIVIIGTHAMPTRKAMFNLSSLMTIVDLFSGTDPGI